MPGSLDDNPPKLFSGNEYNYFVLGQDQARIYVSKQCGMNRHAIAAQLRRLADYLDTMTS